MKHPKLQRLSNRLERFLFKVVVSFISGLLLTALLARFGSGLAFGQTDLIAPVYREPTPEERALAKRPLPFSDSTSIPDEIEICMGSSGERFDLFGTVQDADKPYYLLGIYPDFVNNNPLDTYDELVETNPATGCTRLTSVDSVSKPLSFYMSETAAQDLELQRYQHYITQLGGVNQFERSLAAHIDAALGYYLLSAEQLRALQQLNVSVPENYRLLTANTFPDS